MEWPHRRKSDGCYACGFCSREFSDRSNRRRHENIIHRKLHRFTCTICAKTFGEAKQLDGHMNRHLGKRPHECEECGERFAYRSSLNGHIKQRHRRETEEAVLGGGSEMWEAI